MPADLSPLIDRFSEQTVLVVGDVILDSYLEGTAAHCCREAPVPRVTLSRRHDEPGGAANAAVNLTALGARTSCLAVIGDDAEANSLSCSLAEQGVGTDALVTWPGRRTIAKHRIVAAGQILLRFDQGDTGPIAADAEHALIDRLTDLYARCDALLVSDYGYGTLTPGVLGALAALQVRWPRVLVVDSRQRLAEFRRIAPTAVKPNEEEARSLLADVTLDGNDRVAALWGQGQRLLERTGARLVALTLDSDGAVVFERGQPPYRTFARAGRAACVAGAGDTFVAALTLALAAGAPGHAAAELASAASAVVVSKEGTAVCTAAELRDQLAPTEKYVPDLARLAARLDYCRRQGRRVVFTNGCFDILHKGHINYLNQAKSLGDVLVVGVNGDEGIRRLKGPGRPINSLEDRVQVLAALSCVDHLIGFDEDTASGLLRALRPDVFVKGGDYTRERLPEAPVADELGIRVVILPYVQDRSTTGLIERIRRAAPAPELPATVPVSSV